VGHAGRAGNLRPRNSTHLAHRRYPAKCGTASELSHQRCRGHGIGIQGVDIGADIPTFIDGAAARRTLDGWPHQLLGLSTNTHVAPRIQPIGLPNGAAARPRS
jgi:hypothetical protein